MPGADGHDLGITFGKTADGSADVVGHGGKRACLNHRQSELVRLTARGAPHPIGRKFLIAHIWGAAPPSSADIMLDQVARACDGLLQPLGLTMKIVKGVGIALQKREAGDD